MRLIRLALASLLFALVFSAQARGATITVYSDASAFAAAVGSTTLIDFEAQNNNGDNSYEYHGTLLTVGDVSFVNPEARLFVIGSDYAGYATQGLTSDYLNRNISSPAGINVSFANGVSGVGMGLGYLFGSSNAITFTLSTGDVINTTAPQVSGNSNPLVFFGFTSNVPIVSFNVNGGSGVEVIDDFRYAESLATVPDLTSTLSLLSVSLAGLIATRKRFSTLTTRRQTPC